MHASVYVELGACVAINSFVGTCLQILSGGASEQFMHSCNWHTVYCSCKYP